MEQHKMRQQESDRKMKYDGNIELASVMKQGRVGNPKRDPNTGMLMNARLVQSDVTKEQVGVR